MPAGPLILERGRRLRVFSWTPPCGPRQGVTPGYLPTGRRLYVIDHASHARHCCRDSPGGSSGGPARGTNSAKLTSATNPANVMHLMAYSAWAAEGQWQTSTLRPFRT